MPKRVLMQRAPQAPPSRGVSSDRHQGSCQFNVLKIGVSINRCLQRMPPTGFLPTDANGCQRVPTGANGFFCQRVPNNGFFCQRCPLPNNGFFCQRVSTTGWKKNHGHFVLGYGGFLATGVHNGCSRWGGSVGSPRVSRQAGRQAGRRACVRAFSMGDSVIVTESGTLQNGFTPTA
jgi:hypothetical protein